jgi:hypothetical protein
MTDENTISFATRRVDFAIDGQSSILLAGLIRNHDDVSSLNGLEALTSYGVTLRNNR